MKVYVHNKGFIITGKAWEVRRKLKQYSKEFRLVQDWVNAATNNTKVQSRHL